MVGTDVTILSGNPCAAQRDACLNCHSHFAAIRPLIKSVLVSKHFLKDLKNDKEAESIVKDILDCSNVDFNEMHKFEENVGGSMIFRAKKGSTHIVYSVDKRMRIVFLRAFRNYGEYTKFLEDKKEIVRMIAHA